MFKVTERRDNLVAFKYDNGKITRVFWALPVPSGGYGWACPMTDNGGVPAELKDVRHDTLDNMVDSVLALN